MSNDLLYSVGVSATDLETGVSAVEARVLASTGRMTDAERAVAKANTSAFDETYSAEAKLAAYRKETAFARMSDEEKLAVFRHEGMALLAQIQASEGRSAEHAGLQLQFEQKKTQIYDLNQKITREQTAALAEQTPVHAKHEGLLGQMEDWGKKIKKGFHEMGISLHGAGIGLLLAEIVMLTKEGINAAQKQRDEYEKMGKPLSGTTTALAGLGDQLDKLKHGAESTAGAVVGFIAQAGEGYGMMINRMRGITAEQERQAELLERAADLAVARADKKKQELFDEEKISALRREIVEAEKRAYADQANDTERLKLKMAEILHLEEQIKTETQGTTLWYQHKKELVEKTNELVKDTIAYIKRTADLEMEAIKTVAPLALSFQDKKNILRKEEAVLLKELHQFEQGSAEYAEVANKLQANTVAQTVLQRELNQKLALDHEAQIELARLEIKSLGSLTSEERLRLDVLRLQKQEKENQFKIDELLEKKIATGLTPAESDRLKELFKQEEKLEKQIAQKQALIDSTRKQALAEGSVTTELEKQAAAQEKLNKDIAEAAKAMQAYTGMFTGLHNLENLSTDVLAAKRQKVQDDMDKYRQGWHGTVGVPFIEGDETFNIIKSQLSSLDIELRRRELLATANARGGRAGTLQAYVGSGGDPLAFDTIYNQLGNWTTGQTETNQHLDRATKGITQITGQLDTILGKK